MANVDLYNFSIDVDGCTYTVKVSYCGDLITVNDANGLLVADCERNNDSETVYFSYYDEDESEIPDHSGAQNSLYKSSIRDIASWLVSTHPCI